tara:strand:- start:77 stop:667 length:591 start_codon:yes stop_codon:yes gene_type:complete
MKKPVLIGILFAAGWIVFKLIFFLFATGEMRYNIIPSVMINILFLLLAIFCSLYFQKRFNRNDTSILTDIKNAMSSALPYTIIVSVFIYFYYGSVDPEFNRHQISQAENHIEAQLNDEELLRKLKQSNENFKFMQKEEIKIQMMQGPISNYAPGPTMSLSLLAMLLLSTTYSIFVTLIMRKFIFQGHSDSSAPRAS